MWSRTQREAIRMHAKQRIHLEIFCFALIKCMRCTHFSLVLVHQGWHDQLTTKLNSWPSSICLYLYGAYYCRCHVEII
jgi:hypothetical protein